MDGSIEEILAPLRQAVKEQVRKMHTSLIYVILGCIFNLICI